MKTSDKILLTSALSSIGILGLVHLTLFAEYKRGDILTEKGIHAEDFRRVDIPAPEYVSVHGLFRVDIIPSDTFYIEFEKNDQHVPGAGLILKGGDPSRTKKPAYQVIGDSLLITGPDVVPINRNLNPNILWDFPRVNIYCGHCKGIFLEGCQAIVEGDKDRGGPTIRFAAKDAAPQFTAKDAIVWIGETHNWETGKDTSRSFYDSVSFDLVNSTLLLNPRASIRYLRASLDDGSEINDQHATIEKPVISGSGQARINLTGTTLNKLLSQPHTGN